MSKFTRKSNKVEIIRREQKCPNHQTRCNKFDIQKSLKVSCNFILYMINILHALLHKIHLAENTNSDCRIADDLSNAKRATLRYSF